MDNFCFCITVYSLKVELMKFILGAVRLVKWYPMPLDEILTHFSKFALQNYVYFYLRHKMSVWMEALYEMCSFLRNVMS